jgi:hypothetical protein
VREPESSVQLDVKPRALHFVSTAAALRRTVHVTCEIHVSATVFVDGGGFLFGVAGQEVSQALVSVVDSLSLRWTCFRPFVASASE